MSSNILSGRDGYVLVKFDGEVLYTSVIPASIIKEAGDIAYGTKFTIAWDDGKEYQATLMFAGKKAQCNKKQREFERGEDSEELPNPKRPKKTASKKLKSSKDKNPTEATEKEAKKDDFELIIGNSPPKSTTRISPETVIQALDSNEFEEIKTEDFKATILEKFEELKTWMDGKFEGLSKDLHTIMVSGVAKALVPPVPAVSQQPVPAVSQQPIPAVSQQPVPTVSQPPVPAVCQLQPMTSTNPICALEDMSESVALVDNSLELEISTSGDGNEENDERDHRVGRETDYPDADQLLNIFMKSQDRKSFARELALKIFDEDTLINSNVNGSIVNGKKKPALDKAKVAFIKEKTFHYHGKSSNDVEEWAKCVTAINDKARAIKRQRKVKQALAAQNTN